MNKLPYPENILSDLDVPVFNIPDQQAGLEYAISLLREKHANSVLYRYRDGMSYNAIGRMTGFSGTTIKHHIDRAFLKFRNEKVFPYIVFGYHRITDILKCEENKLNQMLDSGVRINGVDDCSDFGVLQHSRDIISVIGDIEELMPGVSASGSTNTRELLAEVRAGEAVTALTGSLDASVKATVDAVSILKKMKETGVLDQPLLLMRLIAVSDTPISQFTSHSYTSSLGEYVRLMWEDPKRMRQLMSSSPRGMMGFISGMEEMGLRVPLFLKYCKNSPLEVVIPVSTLTELTESALSGYPEQFQHGIDIGELLEFKDFDRVVELSAMDTTGGKDVPESADASKAFEPAINQNDLIQNGDKFEAFMRNMVAEGIFPNQAIIEERKRFMEKRRIEEGNKEYYRTYRESAEDSKIVKAAIGINHDIIMEQIRSVISSFGPASEGNESIYSYFMDKVINRLYEYDNFWSRDVLSNQCNGLAVGDKTDDLKRGESGSGQNQNKEYNPRTRALAIDIIWALDSIEDACAETFPFWTMSRLMKKYDIEFKAGWM